MSNRDRLILVTGASGHQGEAVARHLLSHGFAVRAFVHAGSPHRARVSALADAGAEVVEGDLDHRPTLERSLYDAYGVFSVQPVSGESEVRRGDLLADLAKAASVLHFVYSSVGSADGATGIPHFETKWRIEEHLRDIGLPHTILRPVNFYYNYDQPSVRTRLLEGTFATPLSPETLLQQLSQEDYGEMVAKTFEAPERFLDRSIDVASTELTMLEVADVFTRVIGRNVHYHRLDWAQFQEMVGPELTLMFRWFEDVGYRADLVSLQQEFGPLTSLETHLRTHGWEDLAAGSDVHAPG